MKWLIVGGNNNFISVKNINISWFFILKTKREFNLSEYI